MCGIYFSTLNETALNDSKFLSRGPDKFNQLKIDNLCMEHSLLSLTGEFTPQPILKEDVFLMFNGQIYNYDSDHYLSDSYFILDKYLEDSDNFFNSLDGEYSIVIYDKKKQIVIFLTDIFGTKPLYFAHENNQLTVSSLQSSLEQNSHTNFSKCTPNTIYTFNLESQKLNIREEYFKFNTDQFKTNLTDWNELFINSILKRFGNLNHDIILPLSSGHDSGAIACALDILNINYYSISIFNNEHRKVLISRLLKRVLKSPNMTKFKLKLDHATKESKRKYLIENCDNFFYGPDIQNLTIDGKDDPGAIGLTYVLDRAEKINSKIKIVASGQGGDEIYSNNQNYTFDKPNPKYFSGNLSKQFPWQNFYYGSQISYLSKEESIGGSFGFETRYPFLDKFLVQEYLNLSPEIKNKEYKSPITNFLKVNKYPYRNNDYKTGFNP